MRSAIFLLALLSAPLALAQDDEPQEHTGPLERFKLSDLPPRELTLDLADCSQLGCNLEARLHEHGARRLAVKLPWRSNGKHASVEQTHTLAGVGDPLRSPEPTQVWRIGTPEQDTTFDLAVRELKLGDGWRGYLVSIEAGYEHLKRQYVAYVTDGQELIRAWTYKEPQGRYGSTVDVRDLDQDGIDEVLLYEIAYGKVDKLGLEVLRYSAEEHELKADPKAKPKLHVVAALLDTPNDLRLTQRNEPECLGDLLVLDRQSIPRLGKGKHVLGLVGTRRELAERRKGELEACPTPFKAKVLEAN